MYCSMLLMWLWDLAITQLDQRIQKVKRVNEVELFESACFFVHGAG